VLSSILPIVVALAIAIQQPGNLKRNPEPEKQSTVGPTVSPSQQRSLPQLVATARAAVATLTTYDEDGAILSQGSGFFVGKDRYLVTSRHVLEDAHSARARLTDGQTYDVADVVAEDVGADLVQLRVNMPSGAMPQALRPASSLPQVGTQVIAIGTPLGLEYSVSDGLISGVRATKQYGMVLQVSAPISPGSSGGPVISVSTGEVVGVATFTLTEGQNLNFAIPISRVLTLKLGHTRTLRAWAFGITDDQLTTSDSLIEKGKQSFRSNDINKALLYFQEALSVNPRDSTAWFVASVCYGMLGRLSEAIDSMTKAVSTNPRNVDLQVILANTFEQAGKLKEAGQAYERAIRQYRPSADAFAGASDFYRRQGMQQRAEQVITDFVEASDNRAQAYYQLGTAYKHLNQFGFAVQAYQQAIQVDSRLQAAYIELAETQVNNQSKKEDAVETLKRAIRIWPSDPNLHFKLGNAYSAPTGSIFAKGLPGGISKEDNERAIAAYRQAAALAPKWADPYVFLGLCYVYLERWRDAVDALERAVLLREAPFARYYLGFSYLRLGDSTAALRQYKILSESRDAEAAKLAEDLFRLLPE
jgi:tetratricopeptide (TPR) repeat protein